MAFTMKITTGITLLLVGFLTNAQQADLFTNDWYLTSITIDDEEFLTPPSDIHSYTGEVGTINYFTNFESNYLFFTDGCNEISVDMTDLDEDSFTVNQLSITLMDCMFPLYDAHDGRVLLFFGGEGWGTNLPWEGFHYEIITNSDDSKTLIITNPDGDIALYGNQYLSTTDISNLNENPFQAAFQHDDLIIHNASAIAQTVSIYDLSGKLILTSHVQNNIVQTTGIPKGIYIVQIKDENGLVYTKKLRKK